MMICPHRKCAAKPTRGLVGICDARAVLCYQALDMCQKACAIKTDAAAPGSGGASQ